MKAGSLTLLIADDDEDDRLLIAEALDEAKVRNPVRFLEDGQALMDLLERWKAGDEPFLTPGLILLDLNMPRLDGRATLERLKADERLRRIPVVVLTTSKSEADIFRSYDLGVAGYIVKPAVFDGLVQAMRGLGTYWLEIVALPDPPVELAVRGRS